jgi:uncharacterized heparinase superfamily protein
MQPEVTIILHFDRNLIRDLALKLRYIRNICANCDRARYVEDIPGMVEAASVSCNC